MQTQELLRFLEKTIPQVQTPYFELIDNVQLVGTNHEERIDRSQERQFGKMMRKASHILVEGFKDMERPIGALARGLDAQALQYGYGKLVYLEENTHLPTLAQKYGLAIEQSAIYQTLVFSASAMAMLNPKDIMPATQDYINSIANDPMYGGFDVDHTLQAIKRIYNEIPEKVILAPSIYYQFTSPIREVEYLCPRIAHYKSISESPAVVIGAAHIPNTRKALHGEPIPPAETWQQYVAKLPSMFAEFTHDIRALV